jgi:hypothetical protein
MPHYSQKDYTSCDCKSLYLASTLKLQLKLYQDGILRVIIDEREQSNAKRFRLSEHDDETVIAESQLKQVNIKSHARLSDDRKMLTIRTWSEDQLTAYEFDLQYASFRLEQRVNGISTMVVNKHDTLLFEGYQRFYEEKLI